MARNAIVGLVALTLVLALFASHFGGGGSSSSAPTGAAEEIARLRYANTLLQSKLNAYEARLAEEVAALESKLQTAEARVSPGKKERGWRKRLAAADKSCDCSSTSTSATAAAPAASAAPAAQAATSAGGLNMTQLLLQAHSKWDWRAIVTEMLQPWMRIEPAQLETAVAACNDNGTMYCQRMQIYDGNLYLTDYRAIFFDRHYAPARIMPILETLRRHPNLPNMDIVVAGNDEPRESRRPAPTQLSAQGIRYVPLSLSRTLTPSGVPSQPGERWSWSRTCKRWPGGNGNMPPAIFASTVNRAVFDLPWLDFAWFFPRRPHKLRTPPWSKLQPSLVAAGGSVTWESKIELAMHTGNVGSPYRKTLSEVARVNPETILVNELFIGDHGKIRKTCAELGIHDKGTARCRRPKPSFSCSKLACPRGLACHAAATRCCHPLLPPTADATRTRWTPPRITGGFQQHKCYMTFAEQCGYKYLLNSASIGYANKFKSLLLCGSVVIYVREGMRHKEFYEYGLISGVHYVAVDTAKDIPAMVQWLKKNDDYARAVALAGRARMSTLDVGALTDFMAEVLTTYAARQAFRPKIQEGAVRIDCEDDLWRHYALSKPWMSAYISEDNSTCVHPPKPGDVLGPPGWGGAYAGSKPRCYASHDMGPRAQPLACDFNKPFSTSESFEPYGKFPKPHPNDREHWLTS